MILKKVGLSLQHDSSATHPTLLNVQANKSQDILLSQMF